MQTYTPIQYIKTHAFTPMVALLLREKIVNLENKY